MINNGTTSTYFRVKRGVRQGNPLSLNLFVSAVEILAHIIGINTNIKGLKIMIQMIKLLQYADDTLGLVQDEINIYKTYFTSYYIFQTYFRVDTRLVVNRIEQTSP